MSDWIAELVQEGIKKGAEYTIPPNVRYRIVNTADDLRLSF